MMHLEEGELTRAGSLPEGKRYSYTVREAARLDSVWGLWSGGRWATITDEVGRELAPVWPRPEFAQAYIGAAQQGIEVRRMTLDYWLERWLTVMSNRHTLVAVFPTPANPGVVVSPVHLMHDLKAELAGYGY